MLFSILMLFSSFFAIAQTEQNSNNYLPNPQHPELFKTIPLINDNSPEWVKLMYNESPDYFTIEAAYEKYYRENDFVKNTHTQNYRYWSRTINAENYLQEDGSIYIPTPEEIRKKEAFLKEKHEKFAAKGAKSGNWQCIGPFETFDTDGITKKSMQVNIYAISQAPSNPNILYSGAEGGGVFKTIDKGLNWIPIAEDISMGGIGAIEIDPTNENIVYLSTGNKLYKTIDGGATWTTIEDISSNSITDISINPIDPQILHTAGKKGLKRSTDGGANWTTILTDKCYDIELKTDDPNTIFVAKYNPTKIITEIWKSTDNGLTFTAKVTGWFEPIGGVAPYTEGARIGVTNADPNRLYVILLGGDNDEVNDNNFIGIYRSDDTGETWSTPYDGNGDGNPDNEPGGPYSDDHWCFTSFHPTFNWGGIYNQGFFDLAIDVSDTDADKFLIGSLNWFKSDNGGVTYTGWGGYFCESCGSGYRHPDVQEIEINGNDVWVASDGGVVLLDNNFDYVEARNKGLSGSAYWALGQGWNEDVITGGRYHNGNGAHHENYGNGVFISLGGGESPTGYVNQGENRKVHHSDIPSKLLPETLTGGVSDIDKYAKFPNEAYLSYNKSEIVTDPRSWNTLYLGKENKVWKSEDGGTSFNEIGAFGSVTGDIVLGIEISRNNPDVIYAVQKIQWCAKLWKTTDAGATWSEVAIPDCTSSIFISVSASDENVIFLAVHNGSTNTNKIFKSTDGGASWTNISDPIFDGETPKGLQVQDGTDGGVYVVTDQKIYYKNNTIAWQLFSDGLPAKINYMGFLPFYRDGKVRLATENRAIWESPFYEPSSPIAQPMLSASSSYCARDTLYFENYSVSSAGATYNWSFSPAPQWLSSVSARNPKVKFGAAGTFSATLTVTDAYGTDTKTVNDIVTISAECEPETIPGSAVQMSASGDYCNIPDMNLTTNTVTFSAWIKPNGPQSDYTGIIFNDGTSAGLNFSGGKLAYHWPGGAWWWTSNLVVPDGVWSHVAMVVKPSSVTVYLNGESDSHSFTVGMVELGTMKLGSYKAQSARNYKGLMDEVCIYNASLTEEQIRELMYKTKDPVSLPNLIHYYQFNRASGSITDRVDIAHASLKGNATRTSSTAPIPYSTIANGNWSTDATWNTGQNAPVKDWARVKLENDVTLDQNQTLKSLEIAPTGNLTIASTQQLSMDGNELSNNSGTNGLVLKSDASGTASLLHNTDNINATVERHFTKDKWHLSSSPISNALSGVYMGVYLSYFNENDSTWTGISETNIPLTPGKGYAIWYEDNDASSYTVDYSGTLNNGDLSPSISYTTSASHDGKGWNLIGNPFPSSLEWTDSWAQSHLDHTIYVYDGTQYLTWNHNNGGMAYGTKGNGDIPIGQGFWVKANQVGASITIPQYARKHSSQGFYKDAESIANFIKLKVDGMDYSDQTIVYFNQQATNDFDSQFDAWKMKGIKEAPQFYTYSSNKELTVNSLPFNNETLSIPCGFEVGIDGQYTISLLETENIDPSIEIYLEDVLNDNLVDLRSSTLYSFNAHSTDQNDRFILHFKNKAFGIDEDKVSQFQIYSYGKSAYVITPQGIQGDIEIYNMLGQKVTHQIINNTINKISLKQSAHYIVKVKSEDRVESEKVFIN